MQYLAQMIAIAISETMQTPPTSEPAIRESCCPNSDLYSSRNRHTELVVTAAQRTLCYTHSPNQTSLRSKIRAEYFFFFSFPVAHEVTFARLISHRNPGPPHSGSQSRAEFNYFTARFSLLLSLSNSRTLFPLHRRHSSHPHVPAQRKIGKKKKEKTLTIGESLEEHILAVGSVSGHGARPHLDHVASPGPETLQDDTGGFALHD